MGNARKHNHRTRHKSGKVSRRVDIRRRGAVPAASGLASGWSAKRTVSQNYARLGLATDTNAQGVIAREHGLGRLSGALGVSFEFRELTPEEKEAMAESMKELDRNPSRPLLHVSDAQVAYVTPLLAKYGEDYAKMARDTKLNYMQHTAAHLQTLVRRMHASRGESAAAAAGAQGEDTTATTTGAAAASAEPGTTSAKTVLAAAVERKAAAEDKKTAGKKSVAAGKTAPKATTAKANKKASS